MKTRKSKASKMILKLFLSAGALIALSVTTMAQPLFQPVHFFGLTDLEGIGLTTPLIKARDGNLYGTIETGQDTGFGAVYRITTNGSFAIVYSLNGGSDGAEPQAGVYQASDGKLYGTASFGGMGEAGTVFSVTTNGEFTLLYTFTNGLDGGNPAASLVQASDGNLYGTASGGGTIDCGTVFQISTNGQFVLLHSFSGSDGEHPMAGLMQAIDSNLYGTTFSGGSEGAGTVFRISTNGAFTSLYSFPGGGGGDRPQCVLAQGDPDENLYGTTATTVFRMTTGGFLTTIANVGGDYIFGGLVQGTDLYFYGTTVGGGTNSEGSIFRVSRTGADFATVASFGIPSGCVEPSAAVVQTADGNFYGTTYGGFGSIYQLDTNGTLTTLYSFYGNLGQEPVSLVQGNDGNLYGTTYAGTIYRLSTNGAFVQLSGDDYGITAAMIAANDGNLYGTSYAEGSSNLGTVFRATTNGVFTILYSFTNGADGANPQAALMQAADGSFYGTAENGGAGSNGTIFRFTADGALTPLYAFTGGNDGATPEAALLQRGDGSLLGTATYGGAGSNGTLYVITTNGAFSLLHSFGVAPNDGANPDAPLLQANNGIFYGTTANGGASNGGAIFQLATNGAFSILYSFTGQNDGARPNGVIQARDGNLYGTTFSTVFQITTAGALTTIYTFSTTNQIWGLYPNSGLTEASDGNLYGTTGLGGVVYGGIIFRVVPGASVAGPIIQFPSLLSGGLSFSFPTAAGQSYTVQQSTNLATTNWTYYTNLVGAGSAVQLAIPSTKNAQFFRIREP